MATTDTVEYERSTRRNAGQSDYQPERESGDLSSQPHGPTLDSALHAGSRQSTNAPVRAQAILSAQRTYGNRAVQRFCQHGRGSPLAHSDALTISVQRFQGPDSDWWKTTGINGAMGLSNTVAALPGIGNLGSGLLAGGFLTGSTIAGLTGNEEEAKKLRGGASYFGMHAIPGIGNALAAKHAAQDWGAFGENLSGRQAEGSAQSWGRETVPNLDKFLASLF